MSDFWSAEQIVKIKEEYLKPRTVREMQTWLQQVDYDLVQQASSFWPVNYSNINDHPLNIKNFTFQKIAEISTINLSTVKKQIINDNKNITVKTSSVADWRAHSKEQQFLAEVGFDRETHSQKVTKENYPDLYKLGSLFDLDAYTMAIQYQPPGSILARHVDFLGSMWAQFENKDLDIMNLSFNPLTKSPDGYYAFRCMIALTDYYPGQVFGFENDFWIGWKTGDVVTFDWAHANHYTANASLAPRAYLKVSGITKNKNHWIFNNLNNNIVSQL